VGEQSNENECKRNGITEPHLRKTARDALEPNKEFAFDQKGVKSCRKCCTLVNLPHTVMKVLKLKSATVLLAMLVLLNVCSKHS
jgi:hypothetical protein